MKIALVDGFNLAFRAFYGMPDLAREDGFPTGAIHGWVRTMWWIEDNVKADKVYVFFDLGGASRQLAIREDYKANRGETPKELEQQIPVIKEWTRAAGYAGVEENGIEADDLIAAYSRKLAGDGTDVLVISADKDLAQLVTDKVRQLASRLAGVGSGRGAEEVRRPPRPDCRLPRPDWRCLRQYPRIEGSGSQDSGKMARPVWDPGGNHWPLRGAASKALPGTCPCGS